MKSLPFRGDLFDQPIWLTLSPLQLLCRVFCAGVRANGRLPAKLLPAAAATAAAAAAAAVAAPVSPARLPLCAPLPPTAAAATTTIIFLTDHPVRYGQGDHW